MYSVVLMMAMSGSADLPECRHRCCGCSGGYYYGCSGCYGGYSYGCSGCYGCGGYGGYPTYPGQPMPTPPPQKMPPPAPPQKTSTSDSASIRVKLPADAVLTVDGTATQSASANRMFVTPPLPAGISYQYVMRAQIVRAGQTYVQTQTVAVQAGRETQVSFQFSELPATAAR